MVVICVICTEDLTGDDENVPVGIKVCGHVFHNNCLKTWLVKSSSCPVCRVVALDSPLYVNKLHLQRVSLDNNNNASHSTSVIGSLIDHNMDLEKKLKVVKKNTDEINRAMERLAKREEEIEEQLSKKEEEFKKKEEIWRAKEKAYKQKQLESQNFLNNINEDLKKLESIRSQISSYTHAMVKGKHAVTATATSSTAAPANTSSSSSANSSISSRVSSSRTSSTMAVGVVGRTGTVRPLSRVASTRGRSATISQASGVISINFKQK